MNRSNWFENLPVLGNMPPDEAARKLAAMGDNERAALLQTTDIFESYDPQAFRGESNIFRRLWNRLDCAYKHTAHAFGYLAPLAPEQTAPQPIRYAGNIKADDTLKNGRVTITLDRLRVKDYPGRGVHHVLFDFGAQHHLPGRPDELHFNAVLRAREGEHAAVIGYPIFIGLNVGTAGVAFKCFTVNVKNEDDEAFLEFLENDAVLKGGLRLAATMQPATAPLASLAFGLTKTLAKRAQNVPVQDFYMGLDFSNIATRARLAEGSYIAVQIPESLQTVWDWNEWVFQPHTGQIVGNDDAAALMPYNYIVFSVSRYEDAEPHNM